MTHIVTCGEVLAEFMAAQVGQDLGETGLYKGPYPGGAPAVFIDQAARLDDSAALVSAVGDDAFGRMLTARLAGDGVDVSAIAVLPGQTTASAFVTYHDNGSREFLFNVANSACACMEASQFDVSLCGCRLFHVVGCSLFSDHMMALVQDAVARVKAIGGQVSFDPNIRAETLARPGARDMLMGLLSRTDILLPSEGELEILTGQASEADAVGYALQQGVREIVLKRGRAGCSYYTASGYRDVSGFPADEVDPTGAGDIFGATFCTLRSQGMATDQALVYANAAGARAVSRKGAMEGASSRDELADFIAICK